MPNGSTWPLCACLVFYVQLLILLCLPNSLCYNHLWCCLVHTAIPTLYFYPDCYAYIVMYFLWTSMPNLVCFCNIRLMLSNRTYSTKTCIAKFSFIPYSRFFQRKIISQTSRISRIDCHSWKFYSRNIYFGNNKIVLFIKLDKCVKEDNSLVNSDGVSPSSSEPLTQTIAIILTNWCF